MAERTADSPFHRGEQEIQSRLGVREQLEALGNRVIRDHLPEQHQAFYAQLPFLLLGSLDGAGRPWSSALFGQPGFIRSPDAQTLQIAAQPLIGDPLADQLRPGRQVGILGIEPHTRRRNRLTGVVTATDEDGIRVRVSQTFGNCPQYIQAREFELLAGIDGRDAGGAVEDFTELGPIERGIIERADSFFIATHFAESTDAVSEGADVSHRGGKPGFVRVDDARTLTFPDFSGNFHFNTLGNIVLNPSAGVLFMDFESRDLLYLTVEAEIIWDSEERRAFKGAERLVRFSITSGRRLSETLPLRAYFVDYSPNLGATGSWAEVATAIEARRAGDAWRRFQITDIRRESETIKSFYLEPADGKELPCHVAGQFLPLEIDLPDSSEPVQRTYTISNAPNGKYLRLSIKRESGDGVDRPPGRVSSRFHDEFHPGTQIRAMRPRGKFTLPESCQRPVVLLSGGVGVTPMISMLEALTTHRDSCGGHSPVWFIHGARNGDEHAFGDHVRRLASQCDSIRCHVRYSQPSERDQEGIHYDSRGRVDIALLKALLPFDDYEFYVCGPQPFMQSLIGSLRGLGVREERIHYEFFEAGATLADGTSAAGAPTAIPEQDLPPIAVRFARSAIDTIWEPAKGTLLDLAEAAGIKAAYSCRSGVCQTCATAVHAGAVKYVEPPVTPPPDGMALICSAYPDSRAGDGDQDTLVLEL